MSSISAYRQMITRADKALPRSLTVRRQQMVYWPSVWAQSHMRNMAGSYCVNGFPSSGTNWLCQLVSRYFGVPILEPWTRLTPTLKPHVFHLHRFIDTSAARERTLYITRDGRDAMVSRFMKLSPNPNDHRPLRAFEAASGHVYDKTKATEQLPSFIEWYFTENRFSAMNWATHVQQASHMGLCRLTFEDIKRAPHDTLEPVFEKISGQKIDRALLADVIDQMDFDRVKTPGTAHHKRKSQVGEWRTHFSRAAREVFAFHAQEGLELMGYERDRSWIDAEPLAPEGTHEG